MASVCCTSCGSGANVADAGRAHDWQPDCMEVGPPGEEVYRAVCRDGDLIATFCETDDGALRVGCARLPSEPDLNVAQPLCERTATVLSRSERVNTPSGPTAAVSIERPRLEAVLVATAHGLLFHEDGQITSEELSVQIESGPFGTRRTGRLARYDASSVFAKLRQKLDARGEAERGAHPTVFRYLATRDPAPLVRMTFYDEMVVWVFKTPRPRT